GGVAEWLGRDAVVLRMAFVALSMAAGAGIVVCLGLWLLAGDRVAPQGFSPPTVLSATQQATAVGLVVLGLLLLLRHAGIWLGDAVVWPIALAACGSAVIWVRTVESGRARLSRLAAGFPRGPPQTLAAGPISG